MWRCDCACALNILYHLLSSQQAKAEDDQAEDEKQGVKTNRSLPSESRLRLKRFNPKRSRSFRSKIEV